jgi:hypothetical protein
MLYKSFRIEEFTDDCMLGLGLGDGLGPGPGGRGPGRSGTGGPELGPPGGGRTAWQLITKIAKHTSKTWFLYNNNFK